MHDDWRDFPDTVLRFDDGGSIDLRLPLGDEARARLARLGLDRPFAILTAFNPGGRVRSAARNAAASARLFAELRRLDPHARAATGESLDGAHREPGLAVRIPLDRARAIGRRYGQAAIFWFDGAAFWIHGAVTDAPAVRLPPE
jgi:hypothetical protein